MQLKYTEEQETELVSGYKACEGHDEREDFILKFMGKHGHSKRSIIAKLSKMRNADGTSVYIARPKVSKVTGDTPETKAQMCQHIGNKMGLDISKLEGLDKTPKLTLQRILKRLDELL